MIFIVESSILCFPYRRSPCGFPRRQARHSVDRGKVRQADRWRRRDCRIDRPRRVNAPRGNPLVHESLSADVQALKAEVRHQLHPALD
jgi:hypothetical protein